MEGQSGDCPDDPNRITQLNVTQAAMEGQSGDCPDLVKLIPAITAFRAAMEGQSGDCPDPPVHHRLHATRSTPQWRGSRETARTRWS